MRPSVQISIIPDGQLARVHAAVYDLDEVSGGLPLIEWSYDSGITPPTDPAAVPLWATQLARQLHRHLAERIAPAELPSRSRPMAADHGTYFGLQFPK